MDGLEYIDILLPDVEGGCRFHQLHLQQDEPRVRFEQLVFAWMLGSIWKQCFYRLDGCDQSLRHSLMREMQWMSNEFTWETIRPVFPTAAEPIGYSPLGVRGDVCGPHISRYPDWVQRLFSSIEDQLHPQWTFTPAPLMKAREKNPLRTLKFWERSMNDFSLDLLTDH